MTDQETPGKPAAVPVDLMPRQLHVSIVVDKASCGSGVMLRDLADGKMAGVFGHYMEPAEARKIARWLHHALPTWRRGTTRSAFGSPARAMHPTWCSGPSRSARRRCWDREHRRRSHDELALPSPPLPPMLRCR
jgi:hypothetical protein